MGSLAEGTAITRTFLQRLAVGRCGHRVESHASGWSWTLEREFAERYAKSGATDNRPLLAVVSSLPSAAVLAYIDKDGTSELIVDPLTITIETGDYTNIIFERL